MINFGKKKVIYTIHKNFTIHLKIIYLDRMYMYNLSNRFEVQNFINMNNNLENITSIFNKNISS